MSDLQRAAEMALEALDLVMSHGQSVQKAKDVLRQALEQPEWVGLTDEEVESWRGNFDFFDSALVREVEAKLKEKNT